MEPVTGIQDSGLISILINAFTKFDASFLSSGNPLISGYKLAMPLFRASISAWTPISEGGNPGTPISILMNSTPESCSA